MVDALLLNGPVGVGKSAAAYELARAAVVPTALIDVDEIRRLWPTPTDDPFTHRVAVQNLRSLVANYRSAGARRFVLAGVVEDAAALEEYRDALGPASLLAVRLTADAATVRRRLEARHVDDASGLAWHVERAAELAAILERAALDDVVLDTTHLDAASVAAAVAPVAGWA
ncbi:hypothetical protein GCM10025867_01890 [Frondihabitans sucicola]|uniref:ATP-binding protein n=1 Tax=Frondihabitans sucicola TaxID=1268041 RepID=A0ABN6XX50_9MICO|nr:hypothetical protein [Frondihabitans sucicola]BDZ47948.1 hypothetical protein GCM10025867_01890 [Frondihabitans sucicola]